MQKSAATKVDWTKLTTAMGLRGNTLSSLTAFKKRHDDAKRRVQSLEQQPQTVDFDRYRGTLKNQSIIDEIEKAVNGYQIKKLDVSRQIKAIEAFEAAAVKSAQETEGVVNKELSDLDKTLNNIESARPFDELTTVCSPVQSKLRILRSVPTS